jgi:hypothetical protein
VAEALIAPHTIIAHHHRPPPTPTVPENQAVPWEEAMAPFARFLGITKDNADQPEAGQWLDADDVAKNLLPYCY